VSGNRYFDARFTDKDNNSYVKIPFYMKKWYICARMEQELSVPYNEDEKNFNILGPAALRSRSASLRPG
jgi:uncharacterized protein YqkB